MAKKEKSAIRHENVKTENVMTEPGLPVLVLQVGNIFCRFYSANPERFFAPVIRSEPTLNLVYFRHHFNSLIVY